MASYSFPVEAGHILLFARSISATDKKFYEGDIEAPPTFVQAAAQFDPDNDLRPTIGEPWFGSGATPSGVPASEDEEAGGLHAEQSFEYFKPIKPGDLLTVTDYEGESWEKQGRRGGKLTFTQHISEYRNQDGELVVKVTGLGVQTEHVPS